MEEDWVGHLIHPVRAYWGDGTEDWYKWGKDFEFYKKFFELCSNINDADVAFLPLTLNYYLNNNKINIVDDFVRMAKENGKISFIWIDGDQEVRYINDCIYLKYFGFESRKYDNEIILPGDIKHDLLHKYLEGEIVIKKKMKIPSIGFDGIASYPIPKLLFNINRNIINRMKYYLRLTRFKGDPIIPFLIKRKKILDTLSKSRLIITNFKIRDTFAPGIKDMNNDVRLEFINNILDNDYTLCYRGAANYSLRFYETLCLGRIPLFINTDCKLPYNDQINWKEICIWIEENDFAHFEERIIDEHNSMSESQFVERQNYCREIWVKFLSKEGFNYQFYEELKLNFFNKIVSGK